MVKINQRLFVLVVALAVILAVGCKADRVPQYQVDPSKAPLSKEDAQKQKAKAAEDFSKGYEAKIKSMGYDKTGKAPPPETGKK